MARVILFSTKFPSYHSKKGEPTYFVEAFYKSLYVMKTIPKELEEVFNHDKFINGFSKEHTIRKGKRWKVGDKFSPRIWSGKPYKSKQIILAPDTEIKQVFDIEIRGQAIFINGKFFYQQHVSRFHDDMIKLANNDGLTTGDLREWFQLPADFSGQIICWKDSKTVNY